MEKISVKNLIDFRRKSDKSRQTFVNSLKQVRQIEATSGGDYWISALSSISNSFKTGDKALLQDKINTLSDKIKSSEISQTKIMFQRNIDLLHSFEDFDYSDIKPSHELQFHKKPDYLSLININGLPVQARPHHVFSYSDGKSEEVGSTWFVAKLGGFRKEELAMFSELMKKYLDKNYANSFYVNSAFCSVVDVSLGQKVSYNDIEEGSIPATLEKTINEVKRLM